MRSDRRLPCSPTNSRMFVIMCNRWLCCHNIVIKQTTSIHSPKSKGSIEAELFSLFFCLNVSWTSDINLFKLLKVMNSLKILKYLRGRERLNRMLQCIQELRLRDRQHSCAPGRLVCFWGWSCTVLRSLYWDSQRPGRSWDRIPMGAKFTAPVQADPGARPASCKMGAGSRSRGKAARVWLWPPTFIQHRSLRKSRAIPLLSLRAFVACCRVNSTFTFTCPMATEGSFPAGKWSNHAAAHCLHVL